jgi:hypothetical protein
MRRVVIIFAGLIVLLLLVSAFRSSTSRMSRPASTGPHNQHHVYGRAYGLAETYGGATEPFQDFKQQHVTDTI